MGRSAASWAALLAALLATLLGDPVPARWLCRLVPDHADGRTVFPAGEWLGGLGGSPGGPAAGSVPPFDALGGSQRVGGLAQRPRQVQE